MIDESMAGKIIVGGSNVSGAALRKANQVKAAGVVVGAIIDRDLIDFLGYDIGVAITGQEDIDTTLVITEGFGSIAWPTGLSTCSRAWRASRRPSTARLR